MEDMVCIATDLLFCLVILLQFSLRGYNTKSNNTILAEKVTSQNEFKPVLSFMTE